MGTYPDNGVYPGKGTAGWSCRRQQTFIFRHEGYVQITEDHSLVMELLKNSESMPKNSIHQRHLITRFGYYSPVSVDLCAVSSRPSDYLLLCTDSLTVTLHHPEIEDLLFNSRK